MEQTAKKDYTCRREWAYNLHLILLPALLILASPAFSQTDTVMSAKPVVTYEGFADIFYAYDFNKPRTNYRQPFLYNHNRHNEFNLNLALLKASIRHHKYRGNIALQAGTYATDNYAAEEDLLQHVFEANAGIALSSNDKFWLDAGIFSSHIGFESAVSVDNYTLTRSLLAENSPYYLAGAKVTYNPTPAWTFAVLIVNGWQRIRRVSGNSLPSFGTQVRYTPDETLTLNWSTFIGTDDPDDLRRMRYFNNLYGQFALHERLALITGFDIGLQQQSKGSSTYEVWFSPVAIARYTINSMWSAAFRAEYYSDKKEVIITTPGTNGFRATGWSVNADYSPSKNIICRAEARWLRGDSPVFVKGSGLTDNNFFLVSSIALRINN